MVGYLFQLIQVRLRSLNADHEDQGASLIEYALLVALIAIVCFVAVEFLGESTSQGFSEYGTSLAAAKN